MTEILLKVALNTINPPFKSSTHKTIWSQYTFKALFLLP